MEKILKYSALLYAFLIFIGYFYTDAYYHCFGIDIFSFLDVSEILILFLNNITFLVIVLLLTAVLYAPIFFISSVKLKPVNNLVKKSVDSYVGSNQKRKKTVSTLSLLGAVALLIYIVIKAVMFFINGTIVTHFLTLFLVTVVLFGFMYYYIINKLEKANFNFNRQLLATIFTVALISLLTFMTALFHYARVKRKIIETTFSFNYDSKNYKSNDSLTFIGATSKYLFIRNTKSNTNYIYEKENIRNLELTRKKDDTDYTD